MSIVRQIVDRCHVTDTNLQVTRYLISRLKHGRRTYLSMPRADRRQLLAEALHVHSNNRRMYAAVMHGGL